MSLPLQAALPPSNLGSMSLPQSALPPGNQPPMYGGVHESTVKVIESNSTNGRPRPPSTSSESSWDDQHHQHHHQQQQRTGVDLNNISGFNTPATSALGGSGSAVNGGQQV